MPAESQPVEWIIYLLCLGLAAFVIGLGKSGFGGGLGLLAVVLLSLVASPQQSLGLMLPLVLVGDAVASVQHRGHCDWTLLRPALLGGLAGLAIGGGALLILARFQHSTFEQILAGLVGSACLVVVSALLIQRWAGCDAVMRTTPPRNLAVGLISSALGVVAQAGGPVMGLYIVVSQKDRRRVAGTLTLFFFLMNLAKAPLYVTVGMLSGPTLLHSIGALPLLVLGSWCGASLNQRIPWTPFQSIIYGFTIVSAIGLLAKAFG